MSNLNADITDLVRPYAGSHAVERVTLGIEWKGELTSQVMQRLSKHLDTLEHPFPRKLEIHAKELEGDGDNVSMPTPDEIDLVGLVLKTSAEEDNDSGFKGELAIRDEGLFITIAKGYESWRTTKALILPLVESILAELVEDVVIIAVGLQYVDAFWLHDKVDFERLFNRNNENLPPKVFKSESYWRVEVGFFEPSSGPLNHLFSTLLISYAPPEESDEPEKLTVSCLTRSYLEPEDQSPSLPFSLYDHIYKKNKSLIGDLISSELCELIGLGGKAEAVS